MEEDLANLSIGNEEEDPLLEQDEEEGYEDFCMCLVGKVLTNGIVHFPLMRNVLAKLWHLIAGVSITEIEEKELFFLLYNKLDLKRVIDGSQEVVFGWDISLYASSRRTTVIDSQWIREELRGMVESILGKVIEGRVCK
ncbi:hypothetical protein GOBAR_DD07994 [Gossypium barbadense]|nr:hypothetical protein GOBAR_DD07994 [Gossypium barbadense]